MISNYYVTIANFYRWVVRTLELIMPVLLPSWRFFDVIAPSPRIEYRLCNNKKGLSGESEISDLSREKNMCDTYQKWQEFRPRPAHISFFAMLQRLFWNPLWNESLFLTSCAERLMAAPTDQVKEHSINEIIMRIRDDFQRANNILQYPYLQFRLVFLDGHNQKSYDKIQCHVTFTSDVYPLTKGIK